MIKVLHVINSLAAGGAEKLVSELTTAQSKEFEVSLFTFLKDGDIFREKLGSEVKFYSSSKSGFFNLDSLRELANLIKNNDIIHVHLFPSFYIVAFLSLFYSRKIYIYTEHNTYNKRRKPIYYWIEKWVYSRYKVVVCISKGVKNSLIEWMGKNRTLKIINNFVNLQQIKNVKKETFSLYFREDKILVVMIGSFSDQKDQQTVINAMKILPNNFELLFVGDGPNRKYLKEFTTEIKVGDRVHFLGIKKEVISILKHCKYGVLSSNWEGFGIVALEYMAAGLISLGSDVDGLNEVIPVKENLFKVGDSQALANRIMEIETDLDLQKVIVELQNKTILKFDIDSATVAHAQLYNDCYSNTHQ